jgi:S-adenosylmethionine decarboxylase
MPSVREDLEKRDPIASLPGDDPRAIISQTGTEWLVDAAGCDADRLCDLALMQQACAELVDALRLRVIGNPHWHQFPSPLENDELGGVTGLYLLAESHLTCHTFPEYGRATFNLYCCRSRPAWDWREFLARRLGATQVVVRTVTRGLDAEAPDCEARR